jgi:medium-chain acyl-[acyl-carrier-protein] hydrolase
MQKPAAKTLLSLTPTRHAAVRLVFFPYAGGNAWHIWNWARDFPTNVELLGVRHPEPAGVADANTAQAIAQGIAEDFRRQLDVPSIFFGYSLGALIAFEVCRALARAGLRAPAHLVVAAARAPGRPRTGPPVADLPDAELIEELRRYRGTPEIILQDKGALDLLLPSIRNDLAIAERYRSSDPAPLHCPITAISGSRDELVPVPDVAAWNAHTTGSFDFIPLEGSHFFLHEQPQTIIAIIRRLTDRFHDAGK